MSITLGHPGLDSGTLSYMCDIIVLNSTFESHLGSLEQLFAALQSAGLTLKPSKLQFGKKEIEHLGHVISEKGISVSIDRIKTITQFPTPTCIKDLRSNLGLVNFARRFIKDYAGIPAPLVLLTGKDYVLKKR